MNSDERRIAERLVDDALTRGLTVSVWDGGTWAMGSTHDRSAILGAMFSTSEDTLVFRRDGKSVGKVWLMYGNGRDVLSDWTDSGDVNDLIAGALALADTL